VNRSELRGGCATARGEPVMAGVGRCHRRVSGRCTRPGSQPCPTPSWAARQRPLCSLFEWRGGVILSDRLPADVLPEPDRSVAQLLELPNGVADDWSRHEVELARPDANGTEVHGAGPAIARSRVLSNSCSCSSKSRTAELRAVGPRIRRRSSDRCRTRRIHSPPVNTPSVPAGDMPRAPPALGRVMRDPCVRAAGVVDVVAWPGVAAPVVRSSLSPLRSTRACSHLASGLVINRARVGAPWNPSCFSGGGNVAAARG
jgi:hypothetical protein